MSKAAKMELIVPHPTSVDAAGQPWQAVAAQLNAHLYAIEQRIMSMEDITADRIEARLRQRQLFRADGGVLARLAVVEVQGQELVRRVEKISQSPALFSKQIRRLQQLQREFAAQLAQLSVDLLSPSQRTRTITFCDACLDRLAADTEHETP